MGVSEFPGGSWLGVWSFCRPASIVPFLLVLVAWNWVLSVVFKMCALLLCAKYLAEKQLACGKSYFYLTVWKYAIHPGGKKNKKQTPLPPKKTMVAGSSTVAGVCSWHSSRLLYRWNVNQSGQEVVPCCNSSRPTPSDSLPTGSLHLPKAPENLNCVSSWDPRVQTQKPPGRIKCACKPQCKSKGFIRHFIPWQ